MPSRLWAQPTGILCTLLIAVSPARIRAQDGSLAEAQVIQERIREERLLGNPEDAWYIEQDLLRLVVNNPDDVRSARILRDVGDYRIDILTRYDSGEFPPEIVLGCYYSSSKQFTAMSQRGSRPLAVGPGGDEGFTTCAAGSRRTARLGLAEEALLFYLESARILLRLEDADGDEVRELFMKLLETSYLTSNYRIGRQSLESLLSLQEAHSESWLTRAQTLAFMGDWDLLFAEYFGTKYADSAAVSYARALSMLAEHGVAEDAVNSIFNPPTPVLLPAFAANRLISVKTAESTGHVDVSFEIRESGQSTRIKVLDSPVNAPRSAVRDLINTIKQGRFRPIAANGRLVESAPVTVRFYVGN